jgi:glycolate oxidase FAD binding subunit
MMHPGPLTPALFPEGRGGAGGATGASTPARAPVAEGAGPLPAGESERLTPGTEAELAAMVAEAAAGRTLLRIEGGGTRAGLGRPVEASRTISTAGLHAVTLYEPAALTLVAGAGARLADIEAMLAAEGQRLPFDPLDHRAVYGSDGEPTLGGMVATNASGPRRIQAGACRDSLIGVRFVDGRGTVLKNGGRVMKNVTGYDLMKLLAGSHGTLGVITEVAFKLLPLPETTATLALEGLDDDAAVGAMSAALGSPYDVSGAAHAGGRTLLRVEGFAASVAHRSEGLARLLRRFGTAETLRDEAATAPWRDLAAVRMAEAPGALWRLSLKPSDGPAAVAALRAEGLAGPVVYDWGGGLVWLLTGESGEAGAGAIRGAVSARGGHATLMRASDAVRRVVPPFHPEPAPLAALSAGLRARFDPHGVLNPGRMAA